MRHHVLGIFLGGAYFFGMSVSVQADVFLDTRKTLKDNTDALLGVLANSVVPGGIRSVQINGNDLLVRRFANPVGDQSAFYETWKNAAERKQQANSAIFSLLNDPDPIFNALTMNGPYRSPEQNIGLLLEVSAEFSEQQGKTLKSSVVNAVETPFTYETSQHRVIASIPIKAIDPKSPLANAHAGDGYLFMSEKKTGTTVSDAFWQLDFGENFRFGDLFSSGEEDVNGEQPSIARYPGSKMTMSFSEDANEWHSQSWSYESKGDVLSHISHYVSAFDTAGYGKESNSVVRSDYGLLQFASDRKEATLFVELVEPQSLYVQVTLQVRSN